MRRLSGGMLLISSRAKRAFGEGLISKTNEKAYQKLIAPEVVSGERAIGLRRGEKAYVKLSIGRKLAGWAADLRRWLAAEGDGLEGAWYNDDEDCRLSLRERLVRASFAERKATMTF